jgi:hypothetical protein
VSWIEALHGSTWLYSLLQVVHIAGFVVLVGSVAMFDLRVLGFSRRTPVEALARHLLPWSIGACAVVLPSGLLLFAVDAGQLVSNRMFLLKMLLIAMAGANALAFHTGPYRTVAAWNTGVAAPAIARAHALLSLVLWLGVLAAGRFIAYV